MPSTGIVIPIQSTDAGKQQVKEAVDNLGQQVSALVQQYNDLRGAVEGDASDPATKEKFRQLADQRRAALEQIKLNYVSARQQAEAQGIAAGQNVPNLQGLGSFTLSNITTTVTAEQSKLAVLAAYYESYKSAVAAGTTPPAMPAELQSGVIGIPTTWIAVGLALVAAYFFLGKK